MELGMRLRRQEEIYEQDLYRTVTWYAVQTVVWDRLSVPLWKVVVEEVRFPVDRYLNALLFRRT